MSAGVYNIEIEQGGDYALAVTYKDSSGLVFDLSSGYTAAMNIKEGYIRKWRWVRCIPQGRQNKRV